jgi:hypothetical protein
LSKKIIFGLFLVLFAYTASHSYLNWISFSDIEDNTDITGGDFKPILEELKAALGEIILSVVISIGMYSSKWLMLIPLNSSDAHCRIVGSHLGLVPLLCGLHCLVDDRLGRRFVCHGFDRNIVMNE